VDEGEDDIPLTYAKYGQYALQQPQRVAFQIFDSKGYEIITHFALQDYVGASFTSAGTLEELGDKLAIHPEGFLENLKAYNEAILPGGVGHWYRLAGMAENRQAIGITPPKSSCALPIDTPPFYAYPVCCGITFTFGGLKVNRRAQVLDTTDRPIAGLYAAGEIVGGLFYTNYPGATGLTAGAVFARIAGTNAATD
jgi:tricarballylate dehydrogenase